LVRTDVSVDSVGRVAAVPDDFSPLQLGVTGVFDRRPFTVVGRLRKAWDEGSWNEWCVLFDGPQFGWLGEAQGDWVMTFEQPASALDDIPGAAEAAGAGPGNRWRLGGRDFQVSDVKQVTCAAAEGELAAVFAIGEAVLCVDLRGSGRGSGLAFATVEFHAQRRHVYVGRYVEFSECRFANLRPLDGDV